MHDPTGRERAASHYPGNPEPISAPAGPQPARWGRIPAELRDRCQWLIAAPSKAPYRPVGIGYTRASVTNTQDWLPFDVAATHAAQHPGCGIGYVLSADDPFTCIDLDVKNAVNEPDPRKWSSRDNIDLYWRMAQGFASYTERSQSGQGLHIWCRGKVGKGLKRDGVELYSQERFIVCTGDTVLDAPIRDRQEFLNNMTAQMRALGTVPAALVELPPLESDGGQWQRKANSAAGAKFQTLWFGGWQALDYPSQSEADMALIRMLCFNNPSNEQVRRMFRLSALGQRKKAARMDYVDGMIAQARAADAERERVHAQIGAAMAPGIDAELQAYRNRHRWSA